MSIGTAEELCLLTSPVMCVAPNNTFPKWKLLGKRAESQFVRICGSFKTTLLFTPASTHLTIFRSGFKLFHHPHYFPDLATTDFHLFTYIKNHMRGQRFLDKDDFKTSAEAFLLICLLHFTQTHSMNLIGAEKKCIEANGSYIQI